MVSVLKKWQITMNIRFCVRFVRCYCKVTDLFNTNPRYGWTPVSAHLKSAVDLLRSGVAMAMWFSRPSFHSIFGTPRSPCGEETDFIRTRAQPLVQTAASVMTDNRHLNSNSIPLRDSLSSSTRYGTAVVVLHMVTRAPCFSSRHELHSKWK